MARDLRRYLAGCSSLNRCSCCGAGVGPPSLRRQRAQVISARVGSSAVGDHPATPVWHRSSGACSSPIQWPRLTACTVRPARTTAWTPGSPNTARVEAASGAMSVMCPTIRAASDTAACRQVGRSDGADDEGFAGGVDDFVGDGVELVDVPRSVRGAVPRWTHRTHSGATGFTATHPSRSTPADQGRRHTLRPRPTDDRCHRTTGTCGTPTATRRGPRPVEGRNVRTLAGRVDNRTDHARRPPCPGRCRSGRPDPGLRRHGRAYLRAYFDANSTRPAPTSPKRSPGSLSRRCFLTREASLHT